MDKDNLFPEEALKVLRETVFDPNATRRFEQMSGGFWWSDEFPRAAIHACFDQLNWAWRCVIAYRTSLIIGQPRNEFKATWEHLEMECPQWPGFRPERCSSSLSVELVSKGDRFIKDLEEENRQWNETHPKQ